MSRDAGEFLKDLRAEIGRHQENRADLTKAKLSFVSAFLGVGSLSFDTHPAGTMLLLITPGIALIFDLAILAAENRILRAGAFIRTSDEAPHIERRWEYVAGTHRDNLALAARAGASFLVMLAAGVGLLLSKAPYFSHQTLYIWGLVVFTLWGFIDIAWLHILRRHAKRMEQRRLR